MRGTAGGRWQGLSLLAAPRRLGTCTNRKGIRRGVLEGLILEALKENLMHPDLLAEFIREFRGEPATA
jgi:hypothetical protein